jgi:PKD repeat protein
VEPLEGRVLLSGGNPNQHIDTAVTPEQLAAALVGTGVEVSNVVFTGGAGSTGSFTFDDPAVVGFGQGIVLTSGSAADVAGPNTSDSISTSYGSEGAIGGPGDADLSALAGFDTYDAAVLEFDFVPTANQVVFQYTFSSDEYPEWVDTPFNDVFAFYVNGTNHALVRQTAGDPASPFVPVAVNNINNGNPLHPDFVPTRPDLFRPNYFNPDGPSVIDLEQDGITRVLTFQAPVNPGETNHMKLAIADASDGVYDSAVFIQAGSLVSNENPVADLSVSPESGPAPLAVTAFIEGEDPNGDPLTYSVNWGDGTVSNGPLDQPPDDNEKTATVNHTYALGGNYVVTLTVSNGTLSGTSTEDVEVSGSGNVAPTATLAPPSPGVGGDVTPGAAQYWFKVSYRDVDGTIDWSSVGTGDVRVTGPNGFSQFPSLSNFVSVPGGADVTYKLAAPGGTWDPSDNGAYNISLLPNQVADNAGAFIPAATIGALTVAIPSIPAPTATATAANVSVVATNQWVQVTYAGGAGIDYTSIGANDVLVTGPAGYSATGTLANLVQSSGQWVATYRVPGPGNGTWDAPDNGAYAVAIEAGQVFDLHGNAVPAGEIGTFNVNFADATPPAIAIVGPQIFAGASYVWATVDISDTVGIGFGTIGDGDVRLTGPGGYSQPGVLSNLTVPATNTVRVTYRFAAPGGTVGPEDNGSYTLLVEPNQVADTSGNFTAATVAGAFNVAIPPPGVPGAQPASSGGTTLMLASALPAAERPASALKSAGEDVLA